MMGKKWQTTCGSSAFLKKSAGKKKGRKEERNALVVGRVCSCSLWCLLPRSLISHQAAKPPSHHTMPRYNTRHQARLRAAGKGVEKEHRREKESTVKTTQTAGPAKRARRRVSPRGAQHGPSTEAKPPRRTVDTRGNRRRRHHKQQERYCNDDSDDGDDDDDYDSSELRSKRHKDAEQQHTVAVDTRKPHGGDGTSQQKRQPTPDNSNPVPATPANQNPPKRKSITPRTGEIMKIEAKIAICEAQIKDKQKADKRATTQLQRVQANLATCEEKIKALKSFDQLLEANQAKLEKNEAKLEENQKEQLNWRVKLDAAQQAGNSAREANAQAAIDLLAKAEQRLETEDKRLRRENADIISSEADIRARKEARQRELEAEKQELKAQVTQLTGQFKESQTARAELQAEIGESHLACRQPPSPPLFIRSHLPACT